MLILLICSISGILGLYLGIFGRFINKKDLPKVIIPWFLITTTVLMSIIRSIYRNGAVLIEYSNWLDMHNSEFEIGFYIDSLSLLMSLVVTIIASVVLVYAHEYLDMDPHLRRFTSLLLLFVFFMLILVLSTNIFVFFIGWEGVGVISYLLINFWFTRLEANKSSLKAIIFNRVGDLCFIIFLTGSFYFYGSITFSYINSLNLMISENQIIVNMENLEILLLYLFVGGMCKSAQLGLHAWLPDAMEGPTPVSALLHSATMVTAGLYIFLRLSGILLFFIQLNFWIALIGAVTALTGATIAFFNEDIKKIIAYSTCSQLGLLFSAIGLGNYNGCFFHIVTHAFFKALLFLTAGCVIHAVADEQDIRKMGGLLRYIPYTSICMLIGVLGLIGFPFLSGFYSKEFIIFYSFVQSTYMGNFVTILIFFASVFTMLYGLKLYFLIFMTSYRGFKRNLKNIYEPTLFMSISVGILSILTLFTGYFGYEVLLYNNNFFWLSTFISTENINDSFLKVELVNFFIKNSLIFIFIIFTILFVFKSSLLLEWRLIILNKNIRTQFLINLLNNFIFQSWFFNYIYVLVSYVFFKFSFEIMLSKVSNFIEYILILKTKENIYNYSMTLNSTFSTEFFENLKKVLFFGCFMLSLFLTLGLSKSLIIGYGFIFSVMQLHKKKTTI